MEKHNTGEVLAFVGESIEWRKTMQVVIQTGNLTMTWKDTMVPKDYTETWEYYEYLEN